MDLFSRVMETIFFSLLVFWETFASHSERRAISGGISPKILIQPESRILFDEDINANTVYLSCKATGHPLPRYRWTVNIGLGLREINSTGEENFRVDAKDGQLFLLNPNPKFHHGVYQCTAENAVGAVLSNTALIEFGFLHPFPNTPRPHVLAHVGMANFLACTPPDHYPEGLQFAWYKNERPLNLTENPDTYLSKDGDLYFSSPKSDDAGLYRCHVSHPKIPSAGVQKSQAIPMLVDRPPTPSTSMRPRILDNFPKFIKSTELPTAVMQIMLECVGEGSNLKYQWSRSNTPLTNESRTLEDLGRRLLVYVGHNHTDKYNCTAIGAHGTVSKDLVLSLRDLKPRRLSFSKSLTDQSVSSGMNVTFLCETNIKIGITWYYNGQQFGPGMTNMPHKDLITINRTSDMSSALHITSVIRDVAGVYQCGAGDIQRYIYSSAHLIVDRRHSSGGIGMGHGLDLVPILVMQLIVFQIMGWRGI